MGEGGGFPQVRVMVSQVSPRLPVACPNTESVQNEFYGVPMDLDAGSNN